MITTAAIPLVTGRMYEITWGARAVRSSTATASSLRALCNNTTIAGPGTALLVDNASASLLDWWVAAPANSATYANLLTRSPPFQVSVSGGYDIGIDGVAGAQPVTVWMDTAPFDVRDLGPVQSAWP
jgi:hypothetical protein